MVDKESLRAQVLTASRQLFMSRGYENVGMRDIAAAVGQQPTQVYRLKLSKSDILAELILDLNNKQIAQLPKVLSKIKDGSVLEKIVKYLEIQYKFDIENIELRKVGAVHGWSWNAEYESKNFEQVLKLIHPIAQWMNEAGLDDVDSRCVGIFSLYYVGFRGAVINNFSAAECIATIKPSLIYFVK